MFGMLKEFNVSVYPLSAVKGGKGPGNLLNTQESGAFPLHI